MYTFNNLGNKLKKIRTDKNLKVKEMAALIGVSENTYRNWEKGHKIPYTDSFYKITDALQISIKELYD